jgi:hypothetical protein
MGMGDPVTVDDALLTTADAGFDKLTTLLIGAGAIQVWFNLPMTVYPMFQVLDQEQVLNRWRADFDFSIGAHGVAYDYVVGGANPSDSALATTTNWEAGSPIYSNRKEVRILSAVHNGSSV